MLTRDKYIAILEKRSSVADTESVPNIDNQEIALKERDDNLNDNRDYLKGIFGEAGNVESNQSKTVSRLFPGKSPKESGTVLMKLARQLFDTALGSSDGLIKNASAVYREVALHSFTDELEKISSLLDDLTTRNLMTQPKTYHLPDPDAPTAPRGVARGTVRGAVPGAARTMGQSAVPGSAPGVAQSVGRSAAPSTVPSAAQVAQKLRPATGTSLASKSGFFGRFFH